MAPPPITPADCVQTDKVTRLRLSQRYLRSDRDLQIPIARARPDTASSCPRFPPWEAFERRPHGRTPCRVGGRRPKPFTLRDGHSWVPARDQHDRRVSPLFLRRSMLPSASDHRDRRESTQSRQSPPRCGHSLLRIGPFEPPGGLAGRNVQLSGRPASLSPAFT